MYRQIGKIIRPIKRPSRSFASQALTEKDPLEENRDLTSRANQKKPQREPFVKNLFLGKFDTEFLAYPETTNDKDDIKAFQAKLKPIQDYFSAMGSDKSNISDVDRKSLKLHALGVPEIEQGLELNTTQKLLVYENMIQYPELISILSTHENVGLNILLLYGSDDQKNQYLSRIFAGDCLATLCFIEDKRMETIYFNTTAYLTTDKTHWVLNGTKRWVLNGNKSDVYVVFAQAKTKNEEGLYVPDIVILLVDKNLPGITVEGVKSYGVSDAEYCTITFNDTKIGLDKKIEPGTKNISDILMSILSSNRLAVGAECGARSVDLINKVTDLVINKAPTEIIKSLEWPKKFLAQTQITNYAIESVTYLTAGIDDTYENQDLILETAIVKVFSSESLLKALEHCTRLASPKCYELDYFLNKMQVDVSRFLHFDEHNTSLKLFIALAGLQHIGREIYGEIQKVRNPLIYPGFIFKKIFKELGRNSDNPKLTLHLNQYLHPSLGGPSQLAESCVLRLKNVSDVLLTRYGQGVVDRHFDLMRLADIVIDIYIMVAVLGRASRSYCIGLQNADLEMIMAAAFCHEAVNRINAGITEITQGTFLTNDAHYTKIANRILDTKGHVFVHPTTRNF